MPDWPHLKSTARFFIRKQIQLTKYLATLGLNENLVLIVIAALVGIIAGLGAVAIHHGIEFFQMVFWGNPHLDVDYFHSISLLRRLLMPGIAGLAVGLIIHFFAREAKGHGVPEVMEAIALRNGIIRKRVAAAKLIASSMYIGGGGSVGREGPVIQIGSAIGSFFGQLLRLRTDQIKTLVACGAAAGIAAAFNAPIAGTLFAAEIILGGIEVAQVSSIIVSAVSATAIARSHLGNRTTFSVPEYSLVSFYEFIPYLLLGLLAGIVALSFIKTLHQSELLFERLKLPIYIKTMIGGLAVGILGIAIPHIYGVGYDTMDRALHGLLSWQLLLLLVLVKILATSLSLGSGGSGGVFAPSLFLGATLGGGFGTLVHQFAPAFTATAGAYALIGMGAVVAATTNAPIAAILIIFEMTNDYLIILPLMLAAIVALVFRSTLFQESIYTVKLAARGIRLHHGKDQNVLRTIRVREVFEKKVETIPADMPFQELLRKVLERPHFHYFVVDKNRHFVGMISLKEVQQALQEQDVLKHLLVAHDLANTEAPRLDENDTLDVAMNYFGSYNVDILPVFRGNGKVELVGQLALRQVVDSYNDEISKIDVSSELSNSMKGFTTGETFRFARGYTLSEIRVPKSFAGKSLLALNLRQRFGIQIIFIKRPGLRGKELSIVPMPSEILRDGDKLVLLGPERKIRALKKQQP